MAPSKGPLFTILCVIFILSNPAIAGPDDTDLDLDGDMVPDVEIHFNKENSMIILKNEVYRKGINKYTEYIDLSDIHEVTKQVEMDRSETDSLQRFENVKKQDLEYQCPNFQIDDAYIDDINQVKINDLGASPLRVFHGEHPPRAGELGFIVTISKLNNKEVCEFEYSEHQRKVLKATAMDAIKPDDWEVNDYHHKQKASMAHITTHESCAQKGILVLDPEDMVINMTFNNFHEDRLLGRSSCGRACHSNNVQHDFNLKNSFIDENCLQEGECFQTRPCKYWSFVYEENLCYLHSYVGPEDSVLKYYRNEITGLHGESGCVDKFDNTDPFILSGSNFVVQHKCAITSLLDIQI